MQLHSQITMTKKLHLLVLFCFCIFVSNAQKADWKTFIPQLKDSCKLSTSDFENVRVSSHYQSKNGTMQVIWLRQYVDEMPVFGADMQVTIDKNGKLFSTQCHFIKDVRSRVPNSASSLTMENAASKALQSKGIEKEIRFTDIKEIKVNYWKAKQAGVKGFIYIERLYFPSKDAQLFDCFTFRFTPVNSDAQWQIRIDAATGNILESHNHTLSCQFDAPHFPSGAKPISNKNLETVDQLQSDGSQYRVFPYPLESPLNGPRVLLTNPSDLIASPYGWHDLDGIDGADDTRTIGNNVNAYDDQNNDDLPDDYVDGGALLSFDFPFTTAPNSNPLGNRSASITNLFYDNNRLHDVLWHYGFDETSGNFQNDNYTNVDGSLDPVNAEAFDGSGTNNANFGTPPDGESPRMQMYLWGNNLGSYLTVNSPSSIAGVYVSAVSTFGAQSTPIPITGQLVLMNDGEINPTEGCGSSIDDLTGKIVLIDRGNCYFADKVFNAELMGAIAVIVANNETGTPFSMGGGDPGISIPSLMISQEDGNTIRAALTGNLNVTININSDMNFFDSSFDNGVVAHEYGHGVSNRLTGGPLNVDCLYNAEQAGEGWSDFFALIMTATPDNTANAPRAVGNYVQGTDVNGPGIRVYPYSRDMNINPLTYNEIVNLDEAHGLGTIWCTILWDLYWNMIDVYGYDQDLINGTGGNNKTIQLVMDGMRLQVCSPGFVDSRDAILQADELNYAGANKCLIWNTFARRGLGYSADQGSSEDVYDGLAAFDTPPFCSSTDFANFTASQITVCAGSTITYSDITQPISDSVSWDFAGGLPSVSNNGVVDVTYFYPGTYTTTFTSNTSLGTDDRTQTITVVPSLSLTANVGNASLNADNGFIFITMFGGLEPYHTSWDEIVGLNDLTVNYLAPGTYHVTITDAAGCSLDTNFTVQRPEAIAELSSNLFQISPNPFHDQLSIRFINATSQTQVYLFDLSGRMLLHQQVIPTVNQQIQIPTSNLASGTYLLKVETEGKISSTQRIVKQ